MLTLHKTSLQCATGMVMSVESMVSVVPWCL